MKKLLLMCSFIIPLLFNSAVIIEAKPQYETVSEELNCENPQDSIVRIINNYEVFKSNGFVYKNDDNYTYVIASSNIANNVNNYKIFYKSGKTKSAKILGYDNDYGIVVLRTAKENIKPVCFANSNYIYKGQQNYMYGYYDIDKEFYVKTSLSQIGDLYSKQGYVSVYKSIIDVEGNEIINGSGVFDELNRLIGVVSGYDDKFEGGSYITESNKVLKIADSLLKTGKYQINYIKYNLEDYNNLSSYKKTNYGISDKVDKGVVISTFKPISYLFGGLNQGMVIVSVNGVEIKNAYELDKQLDRYDKNSNVCLKVIKKNGKEAFYHVKV